MKDKVGFSAFLLSVPIILTLLTFPIPIQAATMGDEPPLIQGGGLPLLGIASAASPSVTSISPTKSLRGVTFTLTASGVNMLGAALYFVKPDNTADDQTTATLLTSNSTQATYAVTVSSTAVLGKRSLIFWRSPTDFSIMNDAFQVQPFLVNSITPTKSLRGVPFFTMTVDGVSRIHTEVLRNLFPPLKRFGFRTSYYFFLILLTLITSVTMAFQSPGPLILLSAVIGFIGTVLFSFMILFLNHKLLARALPPFARPGKWALGLMSFTCLAYLALAAAYLKLKFF